MATSIETAQTTENVTAESPERVIADVVPSAVEDLKKTKTVSGSDQNVNSSTAVTAIQEPKHEEVKAEPVPTVVAGASTSVAEEAKDLKKATQDAPSTTATVAQPPKTEDVKIESVSTVVAGVVGDLKNVEVGLAKEAVPATGKSAPAPSLVSTLEGGLKIVEKEAEKGAEETVATVEQHPELIAEGALAAVVGAASLVQPELLPGAVAMVGKMASDSAKKTVTKIAMDEGKKVGTAIAKDVSADAAKEKAAEAAAAGTIEAAKASTDGTKDDALVAKGAANSNATAADPLKDSPITPEVPSGLVNGHDTTEASKEVATVEHPRSGTHSVVAAETVPTATENSKEVEEETNSGLKSTGSLEDGKTPASPDPEHLSTFQQLPKTAVITAVSSSLTTTKTITKNEPDIPLEKKLGTASQESLDLLHKKIDAMHEAIKLITETLAPHIPQPTPAMDASNQSTAEAVPSIQASEQGPISAPAEAQVVPSNPVEPVAQTTEPSSTKRPTLEKRSSVLGSMGKILWPFGSTSPTKTVVEPTGKATAKSDTPKVPTVTVSEVTPGPEIEI